MGTHVNRADFSGYFDIATAATLTPGELIVDNIKQFEDQFSSIKGSNYPIGFVTSIVGTRVNLSNIGVGYQDGDSIIPIHYSIKPLP